MIQTSCHCGSIRIDLPRKPRTLTACNCSICRRTGAQWAYFHAANVRIRAPRGSTESYLWGTGRVRFVRCAKCGVLTHWEMAKQPRSNRLGINLRNIDDPQHTKDVRVRLLDGAHTWRFLD